MQYFDILEIEVSSMPSKSLFMFIATLLTQAKGENETHHEMKHTALLTMKLSPQRSALRALPVYPVFEN